MEIASVYDPSITSPSSNVEVKVKVKVKILYFPFHYWKSKPKWESECKPIYCIGLKWEAGKINLFYREAMGSYIPSGTWAYIDRNIFMLGDQNKRLKHVFLTYPPFFSSPPRTCCSMHNARSRPHTAVLRGKLFVLGDDRGFAYGETGPWGEVYEPVNDKWSPLPEPEDAYKYRYSPMMTAVLHSEDKILLSFTFSRELLAFNVENQVWDIYDRLPNSLPFSGRAIAVDGVLYCCQAGVLYVYNLVTRLTLYITFAKMALLALKNLQYEVIDLLYLPSDVNPSLCHLGDDFFCLIWRAVNGSINFLNFQLSISLNFNCNPFLHSSIKSIDRIDPGFPDLADSLIDSPKKSFNEYNEAGDEVLIEAFMEQNLVK